MKKITLLLSFVVCAMVANAAVTLPITGTLAPTVPEGWTYITNDPAYPNPSFYTTAGAAGFKFSFENQGMLSPEFNTQSSVTVTLNVNALNQNTKTGTNSNYFTILGLNSTGETVATSTFTTIIVGKNSVDLTGVGIVKVKTTMTGYPNDGTKFCNVNMGSIEIKEKTTGLSTTTESKLELIVSGKNLLVKNVVEGSEVEIFSALGSKVLNAVVENGKVNIANLKSGMYVVRSGKMTQKIRL